MKEDIQDSESCIALKWVNEVIEGRCKKEARSRDRNDCNGTGHRVDHRLVDRL